jgi:hypothetical protein
MTKNTVAQFCALAAVVALPSLSFAGTPVKKACCASAPEKISESAITGDIGLNVVSSYYRRGIIQQNHSASFQPYLDVYFKAHEGDGFINKAVLGLGLWNSFSSTGAGNRRPGSTTNSWYESDFTPSLALTAGKFTLTETYLILTFPGDAAASAQALQSRLSFDDSDYLGALALHPAFTHVKELDGKIGTNTNSRGVQTQDKQGNLWELSVAPGTAVGPVSITIPLVLAFGSGGFYNQDGYGYFSGGVNLGYTLPVSKHYGTWTATAGATYYNTSKKATGNRSDNDIVASAGLGVAF